MNKEIIVNMRYVIPLNNFTQFCRDILKYSEFTNIETYLVKSYSANGITKIRTKKAGKHFVNELNYILSLLSRTTYISTGEINSKFKLKYHLSYKTLYRRLTELSIFGYLNIKRYNGGKYGNTILWKLSKSAKIPIIEEEYLNQKEAQHER